MQGVVNDRMSPLYLPFISLLQGAKKMERWGDEVVEEWKPANGVECSATKSSLKSVHRISILSKHLILWNILIDRISVISSDAPFASKPNVCHLRLFLMLVTRVNR